MLKNRRWDFASMFIKMVTRNMHNNSLLKLRLYLDLLANHMSHYYANGT